MENIGNKIIMNNSKKLKNYTYICPDDRKYIKSNDLIKYVNIYDKTQKVKSGIVVTISLDKLILKSINSHLSWNIKLNDHHIFYKFKNDNLMDAINDLLEKYN
jgi:hypothetical protein